MIDAIKEIVDLTHRRNKKDLTSATEELLWQHGSLPLTLSMALAPEFERRYPDKPPPSEADKARLLEELTNQPDYYLSTT